MLSSGKIFVISAPSGTGKTTLNRRLVDENDSVEIAVSLTTRPIRVGEVDGRDYKFVSAEKFKFHQANGEMLETANVFGFSYGTRESEIERIVGSGNTALLEIDVQGWLKAKTKIPNAKAIFILPPALEDLWKRLEERSTDSIEARWRRLRDARREIEQTQSYDYFIINDNLQHAFKELKEIVVSNLPGQIGTKEGNLLCKKLLDEMDNADWFKQLVNRLSKENG